MIAVKSGANKFELVPFALLVAMVLPTASPAVQAEDNPTFGGPDSVENTIEIDRADKGSSIDLGVFESFEQWQSSMKEDHGFSLGMDYSSVTVNASESLPGTDDSASSGMFRVFGSWNLTGDGVSTSGGIVYKLEHRHSYGDPAPSDLYLGNVGYAGLTAPPFSDQGGRFTNLYWRQSMNSGRTVVLGGFLDATDFFDVYGLASPWLHFMNLAFSTGSAATDLPNDAALGVGAGHLFDNNVYMIGSVVDRNSDPTDISEGFDTFFNDNEYFSSIEIGRTSSHSRIALDNVHLSLWHVDSRDEIGAPDGWGANFSWSRYYNNQFMPFIRAGYTDDSGSLLEKSVSVGFGYQPDSTTEAPGNLFGAAVNWGEVNDLSFGPGLDDQYTAEVFYRWQTSKKLALTADIQYLKDPALNPDESSVYVWSMRARFAL
ncbi:MAG: carbohydrate porin [Halioglobus sp.]